jgi:hypothetical protein
MDWNIVRWLGWLATLTVFALALDTDTGDYKHSMAYADAILGRPAREFHIRTLDGWAQWPAKSRDGRELSFDSPRVLLPDISVPYRDFVVEYPPGFLALAIPPAMATTNEWRYAQILSVLMAIALVIAALFGRRLATMLPEGEGDRGRLAGQLLACTLLLGPLIVRRFDAAISALTILGILACLDHRPRRGGGLLGVAIAMKGLPVLALAFVSLVLLTQRRIRDVVIATLVATAACVVLYAPAVLAAGSSVVESFKYHSQRPLQVESSLAATLGVLSAFAPGLRGEVAMTYGSQNFVSPAARLLTPLTTILPTVAVLIIMWLTIRRLRSTQDPRQQRLVGLTGMVVSLAALFSLGKVFSPQYLILLLPAGLIVSACAGRGCLLLFMVVLGVTQLIYPVAYGIVGDDGLNGPAFGALVLLRNGLLLTWAAWLWRKTAPHPRPFSGGRKREADRSLGRSAIEGIDSDPSATPG